MFTFGQALLGVRLQAPITDELSILRCRRMATRDEKRRRRALIYPNWRMVPYGPEGDYAEARPWAVRRKTCLPWAFFSFASGQQDRARESLASPPKTRFLLVGTP